MVVLLMPSLLSYAYKAKCFHFDDLSLSRSLAFWNKILKVKSESLPPKAAVFAFGGEI